MTPQEVAIFKHHDKIKDAKPGNILLVCEPCEALDIEEGGVIQLDAGRSLRVHLSLGGLYCEIADQGRVKTVVIQPKWFHCVELKKASQ